MAVILTRQQLVSLFVNELQALEPRLTDDSEGSLVDSVAGATAQVVTEISQLVLDEFAKTFFESAHGPEVTGGPDDLQTLAVDHFGDDFERPGGNKATGVATFSRPTATAGNVTINAGTVVQTAADSNGQKVRFLTTAVVTLTGTSITANIIAEQSGESGNQLANTIVEIETTLSDPTVSVTNIAVTAGGEDPENDATYRETIRNKLRSLKGATKEALRATALAVSGVRYVSVVEGTLPVIEYDIGAAGIAAGATFFRIPVVKIYVADSSGGSSGGLVTDVQTAIDAVRAAGVVIQVVGALGVELDWTAAIVLNASGPNFATLSSDPQMLLDSMSEYVQNLPIGTDFDRDVADAAIMAIWGPAGTDDLTSFTTTLPIADVDVGTSDKLVPGDMAVA